MTTRRYLLTSSAAVLFVAFLTYTGVTHAQSYGFPSCMTNTPTVSVNQSAVFTAAGGNGSYIWSSDSSGTSNSIGSQFSISFPSSGTYNIRVMSNNQTGTCSLTVVPGSSSNFPQSINFSGTLACLPASQNVAVGQTASFAATGGNGSYSWIIPELSLSNPIGTGSYVTYVTPGTRIVTVMSGGASATCAVNVIGSAAVPVTVVPGLPNTGGGYGRW